MNKRNRVFIGSIAGLIMLACACPVSGLIPGGGETPTPGLPFVPVTEEPPATEAVVPSNVFFSDDFSGSSDEMETYSGETGDAGVENGVYVVRTRDSNTWEWGRSASEFTDTVVDVDATVVSAPSNNNNGFGVYCRVAQSDDGSIDGYMLAISADGFYSIQIFTPDEFKTLVDWTKSGAIKQGSQTNHIRATCSGSELTLEVNGTLVGSAATPADGPASGAIALVAVSFEDAEPSTEIHFDNLVVSQP